ncbi:MAG: HD family hydrolase [Candidatus Omnitrophota bacterium]|nr:MAG: HD family hydrolase [Candidatus Omnitrophota bacterium]
MRYPDKDILNFIAEAGLLKRLRRSGWSVMGVKDAETVAEHSFRCAVIAYLLARMEGVSPYKVLLMALFNDIQEARITDLHKMAQRYIEAHAAEDKSFNEQISSLPKNIKKELKDMYREYKAQQSKESIIARDADILECLIQAKEYYEYGYPEATKFMKKAPRFLKTKSARSVWRQGKNMSLNEWWFELSDFKRL